MIMLDGFFARVRAGQLTAIRCRHCGVLALPPKERCDTCDRRGWEAVPLAGTGTVASFRVIEAPPDESDDATPYAVGVVRLTEGLSLTARIVDLSPSSLAIGQAVRFRPLVEGSRTALAFGPRDAPAASQGT